MSAKKQTYLYLIIFDQSVDEKDPRHADYICIPRCYDMAGYVLRKAEANASDVKDIRMFSYEKKKSWEAAKRHYYDHVADWKLLKQPIKKIANENPD